METAMLFEIIAFAFSATCFGAAELVKAGQQPSRRLTCDHGDWRREERERQIQDARRAEDQRWLENEYRRRELRRLFDDEENERLRRQRRWDWEEDDFLSGRRRERKNNLQENPSMRQGCDGKKDGLRGQIAPRAPAKKKKVFVPHHNKIGEYFDASDGKVMLFYSPAPLSPGNLGEDEPRGEAYHVPSDKALLLCAMVMLNKPPRKIIRELGLSLSSPHDETV